MFDAARLLPITARFTGAVIAAKDNDFLFGSAAWYETEDVSVFLRASTLSCDSAGKFQSGIGIANVNVAKSMQGKGVFKSLVGLLTEIMETYDLDLLQVENVHNPELEAALSRWGFVRRPEYQYDVIMVRYNTQKELRNGNVEKAVDVSDRSDT